MGKNKDYKKIIEKMINSLKIIKNLQKLIENGDFLVKINKNQLIIKKNTHHKFNFNIIFFKSKFKDKDNFQPSKIEIYYFGEKTDDYNISSIAPYDISTELINLGMKYFSEFNIIIIKY